jgi:peptidoglycan/LPS O-acetylase OafA/YrhL
VTLLKSTTSYLNVFKHGGAIPELDGLRGIAILLVLARHAVGPISGPEQSIFKIGSWDIATPMINGWIGVDLFFVLSGFLISHHLLRHWPNQLTGGFLFRYWSKRVFRTFPAYFAVLFLIAFIGFPFYSFQSADFSSELGWHIVFMQDYFGSNFMPAFWSLGVEEKFYLLCPFVMLFLINSPNQETRYRRLALLALFPLVLRAATLIAREPLINSYNEFFWLVRSPAHLALDGLWMGIFCAILFHSRRNVLSDSRNRRNALLAAGIALVSVLLLGTPLFEAGWWTVIFALFLIPLGFAAILFAVISGVTFATGFLSSLLLRFFSNISYSLYLTHMLCIPVALLLTQLVPGFESASALAKLLTFLPIFLLLSVSTALLLHYLVEKPFLILKSRIKLEPANSSAPVGTSIGARIRQ